MKSQHRSNVSRYCDYNETFSGYDLLRRPNGVRELLQLWGEGSVPLAQQVVLEGGFGTGAYIDRLRHDVKEIHGVEGSDEGINRAAAKTKGAANVYLQLGDILHLTFADDSFDAYMVNQVLHHLDVDPAFPNLDLFLTEARRVLKPGGILTVNTSSQEQLDPHTGVFWNYKYIERAVRAIQARHIPVADLVARLERFGFSDIRITFPSENIFQRRYYEDPAFALEPVFQKGDSVYCFLSPSEIETANDRLRSDLKDGSVYEEMKRAAARAAAIGEGVLLSARVPR